MRHPVIHRETGTAWTEVPTCEIVSKEEAEKLLKMVLWVEGRANLPVHLQEHGDERQHEKRRSRLSRRPYTVLCLSNLHNNLCESTMWPLLARLA